MFDVADERWGGVAMVPLLLLSILAVSDLPLLAQGKPGARSQEPGARSQVTLTLILSRCLSGQPSSDREEGFLLLRGQEEPRPARALSLQPCPLQECPGWLSQQSSALRTASVRPGEPPGQQAWPLCPPLSGRSGGHQQHLQSHRVQVGGGEGGDVTI